MAPSKYVGVDGCPYGWFSVGFDESGKYEFKVCKTFDKLLEHYKKAELILVDIPIGLPDGSGGRECDREARRRLGYPRAASIFPTPTRQTVKEVPQKPKKDDYRRVAQREIELSGEWLDPPTFWIATKIAQVDQALRGCHNNAIPEVREVHPELCFWALNDEKPMNLNKKVKKGQKQGLHERKGVLRKKGVEPRTDAIYKAARCKFPKVTQVARDDILDALVAAVTAYKSEGKPCSLPKTPQFASKDPRSRMEMVYWIPN